VAGYREEELKSRSERNEEESVTRRGHQKRYITLEAGGNRKCQLYNVAGENRRNNNGDIGKRKTLNRKKPMRRETSKEIYEVVISAASGRRLFREMMS